jgi:predicted ribosomally synthesized peptide with nif11-like leader
MKTNIADFLALIRNDAAVQERVAAAAKGPNAAEAILEVAAAAGFTLTADDVRKAIGGELGDGALDRVAGGFRAPAEWFAEAFRMDDASTIKKR